MSSSTCLSTSPALTRHIANIDSLPVEMIQKIATYLPANDYDNFRLTKRAICEALISINSMENALAEKPHYGALDAFYRVCTDARQLEARCRRLNINEINTLIEMNVRPDYTRGRDIVVQCRYPMEHLTLNDGILEILDALCRKLTEMAKRQKPSSCPAPRYQYHLSISIDMGTLVVQGGVLFQVRNIRELSQLNDFYTCAHQLYDDLAIPQRIYLTAMMAKLHQFWCAYPPANLDRQTVDNTIRSYASLLRSGNYVLAHCKAMQINASGEASSNP